MNLVERLQRIQYIEYLIKSKAACTVGDLSVKLNTSKRQVSEHIKIMRELGAPIKYNRRTRQLFYEEDKKFVFKYE